ATATASAGTAFYYRPDPGAPDLIATQSRISRTLKSPQELSDNADRPEGILLTVARALVIGTVTGISRTFLFGLNRTKVVEDDRWRRLVELVEHRPPGTPLLTVANHNSTLDDPTLFAAIIPLRLIVQPSLMRWCVCSEEICFANAGLSAFFGAGKVMPIARGPGVDQKLLLDFARRIAAGDWCSIFPEGKTVQTGHLGGRTGTRAQEIGRFKWGVGKLIAHAPVTPVVVPFFHTGMQEVVPEHPVTKDVLNTAPGCGKDITVRVGRPVEVRDLVEAYEQEHGPLRKYHARAVADGTVGVGCSNSDSGDGSGSSCVKEGDENWRRIWASTLQERQLYSAIARRIEIALAELETEARADLGDAYPGIP
ncbi:unnamed protein product, partial [Phaeothamnion confervicola]